jgi:phospholipase D1/2
MADSQLFQPGRNCWRVEHADRAAFVVDGDAYFTAFAEAARLAQHSILITGWDFHSRTPLAWGENGGKSAELGKFLDDLVRGKRGLQVHILIWDYPMVFGLDREWAPILGLGWKPRRRVHLRYDNTHPLGGSHHQKLVVVDDAMAFCGGIDLTCRRWDTCAHAANEPRRMVENSPYPPFHDMMMAVEGPAAKALGDIVRQRWHRATGETLKPPPRPRGSVWPMKVRPDATNVDVAISRTEPAVNGSEGVREVEALFIDMIAAARETIYIENQYFTADRIGNALEARLKEPNGPEIIVVLRKLSHGWLEELTMESLRTRLITRLRAADHAGRLKVFYPFIDGLKDGTCIDIHSKLIIVDDEFARIGSSNLANRSMGFDTECDLTLRAAGRTDVQHAIRGFRAALLAEHLGATREQVEVAIQQTGSLAGAIQKLHREDRTLHELVDLPQVSDAILNMASVADPERPVELGALMKVFNSDVSARKSTTPWGKIAAAVAVLLGLTALWRYTPLSELLNPTRVTGWAREFGGQWWAPFVTVFAYTPACLTMFPRPLITLFAVVAFGPWLGFLYAMTGVQLAAWLTYVAGERLQRDTVRRLAGSKLNAVIEVMRRRGLIAMTALRLVPLAPFAVEGIVAGAVGVKLWHFLLGTALGILPGTLAATVFGNELQSALEDPGKVNYWLIGGALALMVVATLLVRRWLTASTTLESATPSRSKAGSASHGVGSARAA